MNNEEQLIKVISSKSTGDSRHVLLSLLGGAVAGLAVDVALFPLDTIKTRLQSHYGFLKSGGFQGIYKGVGPMAIGSPFSAGLFFGTYDMVKYVLITDVSSSYLPLIHMGGATVGEVVCCIAKVPMEIVKQRRQASYRNLSAIKILQYAIKKDGIRGLYRGYGSTVIRDVPFSIIEFPIWEWLKKRWKLTVKRDLTATEVAVCGSIAGGIAGAITTPLDVVKTQIMLAENQIYYKNNNPGVFASARNIYQQHGISKLFAGFVPRVSMILLGGGIFFGIYEKTCELIRTSNVSKYIQFE